MTFPEEMLINTYSPQIGYQCWLKEMMSGKSACMNQLSLVEVTHESTGNLWVVLSIERSPNSPEMVIWLFWGEERSDSSVEPLPKLLQSAQEPIVKSYTNSSQVIPVPPCLVRCSWTSCVETLADLVLGGQWPCNTPRRVFHSTWLLYSGFGQVTICVLMSCVILNEISLTTV